MFGLTVLLVGRGIEKSLKVVEVGELDLGDPALALRVLVEEGGVGGKRRVGLDDLHVGRGVDIAHRLDALDNAGGLTLLLGSADGGELDVNKVAERLLGVVADAELGNPVALSLHVLVGLGVAGPGEGAAELDAAKAESGLGGAEHCDYSRL